MSVDAVFAFRFFTSILYHQWLIFRNISMNNHSQGTGLLDAAVQVDVDLKNSVPYRLLYIYVCNGMSLFIKGMQAVGD